MANQVTQHPDHDEIASLLPWFVNRTLESQQRASVLKHIETCNDCQREIQFLESLNGTIHNDARDKLSLHADVDRDLASVMDRIEANSHKSSTVASGASLLQKKLSEFFSFATALPVAQLGATAAAGLLVAVLGFQVFFSQSDDSYSVLSSSEITDPAMRLSVETTTTINTEQLRSSIQTRLDKFEQQTEINAGLDGGYIVTFEESVDVSELSQLIADLENDGQITRVEILP